MEIKERNLVFEYSCMEYHCLAV